MNVEHVFAGLPVSDLVVAEAWYARLLGRPPDGRPHDREVVWQLADTGLIYVVVDPARAGHGLLTLIVADLDATLATLKPRGIEAGLIEPVGGGRKATFTDPDGNSIGVAQVGQAA
jgi:catechol 2,3-dioxygenase-like lactoylglutathione lyase family enzyme